MRRWQAAPRAVVLGMLVAGLLLACGPNTGAPSGGSAQPAPAAAAAGSASSTSGAGGASGAAPPAPLRSKSAYTTLAATSNTWWMAKEGGYFVQEGLDVELVHIDAGAALLAALHNGEVDVTGGGGPSIVLGYLQGLNTVLIGATVNTLDGGVYVRPEVQTVDDMRGKTIGVNRLKAISDVGARLGMQTLGLVPDVDFSTRGTGGQAEMLAALEQGMVDGVWLTPPFSFEVMRRGYSELVNVGKLGLPFINGGISSTREKLQERPELGERYLRALARAMSRLHTDREFSMQVLCKYTRVDDREQLGATVDYYARIYPVDPYPEPAAVQAVLDAEEHPAARTTRPEDVVDYRYADAVRASGFLATLPR